MNQAKSHQGQCFCGSVQVEVTGEPAAMGYCHCSSCREWSAGPVNAFSLWPPSAVRIVAGADKLLSYNKTPGTTRRWCSQCGGHVLSEHPAMGLTDVYAAILEDFAFKPALHVFYSETVLPMKDGLPKLKDVPAEIGGSGELVPE